MPASLPQITGLLFAALASTSCALELSVVGAKEASRTAKSQEVGPLRIDGLVAATFTPFAENGSVASDVVEKQAAWLNKTGVEWVFVSGTTGESLKLTKEERLAQAELWLQVAPKYGIRCIIHVGAESIEDAREMAMHAEAHGASAIGAMPPVFFKPANTDALVQTMAPIASAAPSTPFYYYHIPSMTGVAFADGMLGLAKGMEKANVPNFAGVKYTGLYTYPGLMDAMKLLNYRGGKYEVLCGRDELMIEALAVGIKGFVGSQYNILGDLYNAIRGAFANADLEDQRALQSEANAFISLWQNVPAGVNGLKNIFSLVPGTPAVGDARLPNMPISEDTKQALSVALKQWCTSKTVPITVRGNLLGSASSWPSDSLLCKHLAEN